MSPFRKRSELKRVAGGPVFIDLGSVPFPEADDRGKINIFRPADEDGMVAVKESVQRSESVIVDMSGYVGDMAVAESSLGDIVTSTGRTIRKLGSDVWLIVSDDIVAEYP